MESLSDEQRLVGGRYVLEKLIGEGAAGEVWKARHIALKTYVAIKFLHGSSAFRDTVRKRFLAEAQLTAQLKTRHAVQVFDFGVTEQGRPYLIMELLEGETVAQRLHRLRRLPPASTAVILRYAAKALDRAHAIGIIHRDFKPENVTLVNDEEGNESVKVVDFGVAKIIGGLDESDTSLERSGGYRDARDALTSLTRTHSTVGTPCYMAPEQVRGSDSVGPAVDIWAMGVVAFECLTGYRPFRADTLQALFKKIKHGVHPAARAVYPKTPPAFEEWFQTACAIDPEHRFRDAPTAAAALAEALGEVPSTQFSHSGDFTDPNFTHQKLGLAKPAYSMSPRSGFRRPSLAPDETPRNKSLRPANNAPRKLQEMLLGFAATLATLAIIAFAWTLRQTPSPRSSPTPAISAASPPLPVVTAFSPAPQLSKSAPDASVASSSAAGDAPRPPRVEYSARTPDDPAPSRARRLGLVASPSESSKSAPQDAAGLSSRPAFTSTPSGSTLPAPRVVPKGKSSPFELPDLGL